LDWAPQQISSRLLAILAIGSNGFPGANPVTTAPSISLLANNDNGIWEARPPLEAVLRSRGSVEWAASVVLTGPIASFKKSISALKILFENNG
jgi:hypothetical protein